MNLRTRRSCRRHVFSLMEIMIVIVIIGMVAGLVGPALMKNLGKAKKKTALAQVKSLHDACMDYHLDMMTYPTDLQELLKPQGDKWDGPYLDSETVPVDPWGEVYELSGSGGSSGDFGVFSKGPDRTTGTADDIKSRN